MPRRGARRLWLLLLPSSSVAGPRVAHKQNSHGPPLVHLGDEPVYGTTHGQFIDDKYGILFDVVYGTFHVHKHGQVPQLHLNHEIINHLVQHSCGLSTGIICVEDHPGTGPSMPEMYEWWYAVSAHACSCMRPCVKRLKHLISSGSSFSVLGCCWVYTSQ